MSNDAGDWLVIGGFVFVITWILGWSFVIGHFIIKLW